MNHLDFDTVRAEHARRVNDPHADHRRAAGAARDHRSRRIARLVAGSRR